jgi:hypothetical protein
LNKEVLAVGWWSEFFAREKRLKGMAKYLEKEEKPVEQKAHEVAQMFERQMKRQADGDR